jgi:hypothetical protein
MLFRTQMNCNIRLRSENRRTPMAFLSDVSAALTVSTHIITDERDSYRLAQYGGSLSREYRMKAGKLSNWAASR